MIDTTCDHYMREHILERLRHATESPQPYTAIPTSDFAHILAVMESLAAKIDALQPEYGVRLRGNGYEFDAPMGSLKAARDRFRMERDKRWSHRVVAVVRCERSEWEVIEE